MLFYMQNGEDKSNMRNDEVNIFGCILRYLKKEEEKFNIQEAEIIIKF